MGWTNYIIIPKWKLAIEVPRSVEDLESYEREAIEKLLSFCDEVDVFEILEKKYKDITLSDLRVMLNGLKILSNFESMNVESLLLYYLEVGKIEYEVVSEFDFEKRNLKGFTIIRMFGDEE